MSLFTGPQLIDQSGANSGSALNAADLNVFVVAQSFWMNPVTPSFSTFTLTFSTAPQGVVNTGTAALFVTASSTTFVITAFGSGAQDYYVFLLNSGAYSTLNVAAGTALSPGSYPATGFLLCKATSNAGNTAIVGVSTALATITPFPSVGMAIDGSNAAATVGFAGNLTVGGTLAVTGASSLGGNTTVGGTFTASGAGTFPGNVSIGGTLGVTGVTSLGNNLTVGGALGVSGTATLSGNATVGGTLGVTGVTSLGNNLTVGGTLTVTGVSSLNNNVAVGGNLTVGGTATITGALHAGSLALTSGAPVGYIVQIVHKRQTVDNAGLTAAGSFTDYPNLAIPFNATAGNVLVVDVHGAVGLGPNNIAYFAVYVNGTTYPIGALALNTTNGVTTFITGSVSVVVAATGPQTVKLQYSLGGGGQTMTVRPNTGAFNPEQMTIKVTEHL